MLKKQEQKQILHSSLFHSHFFLVPLHPLLRKSKVDPLAQSNCTTFAPPIHYDKGPYELMPQTGKTTTETWSTQMIQWLKANGFTNKKIILSENGCHQ